MHAIVRRYEGIDTKRTDELTRKVGESLTPHGRPTEGEAVGRPCGSIHFRTMSRPNAHLFPPVAE